MEEIWRPVVITKNGITYDYTGKYEVCNKKGKVRALNYNRTGRAEILKPGRNHGYLSVNLHKDGKSQRFLVHRIVAEVFIPNPENKPYVNHLDEDKTNNSVENLEWCTHPENVKYGTGIQRMAEKKKGSKNHNARKVICIETKRVFDTIDDAMEWAGIKSGIILCCQDRAKTAGGYHWEYYD